MIKKEWTSDVPGNMDEIHRHNTEQKKLDTEELDTERPLQDVQE